MKKLRFFRLVPLVIVLTLLAGTMGLTSLNAYATASSKVHQKARYTSIKLHRLGSQTAQNSVTPHTANSIPTWSSSFSYQGQDYPYTMVGTDPNNGSQTSTVPVDIIPLIFHFADGTSLNGNSITSSLASSALFNSASFPTDNTQYFDAFQRANFYNTVSNTSPDYHVLLGTPTVKPTVTLNVPAANGSTQIVSGLRVGYVDITWFQPKADSLTVRNGAAGHLVVFAANNIYQYQGDPTNGCCIGGYHTAVQSGSNTYTYAYAGWDGTGSIFHDIEAMSHEVAEWGDDPFTNNTTPTWSAANYGCSSSLEVGDPAVQSNFNVGGLTYQNEVFFSWFAQESPSQAYQGQYDYLGTLFNSPPANC